MTNKSENLSMYLLEMEKAKQQYQQYMEVSEIYKLLISQPKREPQHEPPSIENPLTTNTVVLTK